MAVFLLKGRARVRLHAARLHGRFPDVACPSTFADWIEQLVTENITVGCGGGNYCPQVANTRGQMAVFLTKTFGLPLTPWGRARRRPEKGLDGLCCYGISCLHKQQRRPSWPTTRSGTCSWLS